jgi:hypothetical protein
VYDAELDLGFGKYLGYGLREALQAINAGDEVK